MFHLTGVIGHHTMNSEILGLPYEFLDRTNAAIRIPSPGSAMYKFLAHRAERNLPAWPIQRSARMTDSAGKERDAENGNADRRSSEGADSEANVLIFGEVQWTSSLHFSAMLPTSEESAQPRSESDDTS